MDDLTKTENIEVQVTQSQTAQSEQSSRNENLEVNEPETKESVLSKIASKVKNFVSGDTEEEEVREVPADFKEAGNKLGWSDEDIDKFASNYTDEELKEMIPSLVVDNSSEEEDDSTKGDETNTPEKDETKDEDSQDDEKIQKLLKPYLDRIDALEKAQGVVDKQNKEQERKNLVQKASQMFDEASKEFEVFGKTDELPTFPDGRLVPNSPQLKARSEVWKYAGVLHKAGVDFDEAMSVSMNAFKGKNLATDVKRSIIKDLKKNESRLSGKRTSHESSNAATYGPDVIKQVMAKHGRT